MTGFIGQSIMIIAISAVWSFFVDTLVYRVIRMIIQLVMMLAKSTLHGVRICLLFDVILQIFRYSISVVELIGLSLIYSRAELT